VDPGTDDWSRCVETNAQMSGELLYLCSSDAAMMPTPWGLKQ
jgi:hypothetical protein